MRSVLLAALLLAAAALVSGGCVEAPSNAGGSASPELQARRFELADFLASSAHALDSPEAARLLAEQGLDWGGGAPLPNVPPFASAPAGFRIAAVAPHGDRVALIRELDADTTEVLLHERAKGETRLLLPVDRDARFLPQRFSADGRILYLFSNEGDDTLQLVLFDLDTGERSERPRAGCEAIRLDVSPDDTVYGLQWTCSGAVEAALFDAATGAPLGPLPLPSGTRLARALPARAPGGVLYEIASGHFPRDLLFVDRLDPEALARPLTYGLSPRIATLDLVDSIAVVLPGRGGGGGEPILPGELWWPRRPAAGPAALIWLEDDLRAPAWLEFHPVLQFLANRGVAILRLRLRGASGFGLRHRHAADGRLLDAGLEDLQSARALLQERGADLQRIAVVGEGPWAGALAAAALRELPGRFAAAASLGGAADPLAQQDLLPTLAEPAKSWWTTRLGDPTSEAARRDRTRMQLPADGPAPQLFLANAPEDGVWSEAAAAALWGFLADHLARGR